MGPKKWFGDKMDKWFEESIKMSKTRKRKGLSPRSLGSTSWLHQALVVDADWVEVEDDHRGRKEIGHYLRRAKDAREFDALMFWLPFVVWGCERKAIYDLQFFAGEGGMIGYVGTVDGKRRTIELHTQGGRPRIKLSLVTDEGLEELDEGQDLKLRGMEADNDLDDGIRGFED